MPTEECDMSRQAEHQQCRQHADVQAVEAGDRLVAVVGAANQDPLQIRPRDRRPAHDVGRDLGRPIALLVPRQQVSRQAEAEREEQQCHPEPPVKLARPAISPGPEHLEEVQHQQNDHRLRGEVMDAADEPAPPHLVADIEDARPGHRRRRAVRRHQKDPGKDLDHEHDRQRRAEDVSPARASGNRFVECFLHQHRGSRSGRRASRPVA